METRRMNDEESAQHLLNGRTSPSGRRRAKSEASSLRSTRSYWPTFEKNTSSPRSYRSCWPSFEKTPSIFSAWHQQITRRRTVIASVLLVMILCGMLIIANPYRQDSGSGSEQKSGKKAGTEYKNNPNLQDDPEICTTWPVNANATYEPKPQSQQEKLQLDSYAPPGGWKKPDDVDIIGMVFYGRKRNVDILDCYLRQNLVSNGGYLDEVWFMVHTEDEDDVAWLEEFVKEEEEYTFVDLGNCTTEDYGCIWEWATDPDTIYFKIDDDIVYIHPDAIPQMVHTRLAQPHPYAISAQLVNSPVTAIESYHYGAIHPFLPDPRHRNWRPASESWRISELPLYPPATKPVDGSALDLKAPYKGHPWLLLSQDPRVGGSGRAMTRTPIAAWNRDMGPDKIAFGPGWKKWPVAAQQLYSLLWNLETNQIHRYFFGRPIDYESDDYTSGRGRKGKAGKAGKGGKGTSLSSSSPYEGEEGSDVWPPQNATQAQLAAEQEHEAKEQQKTTYKGPGGEQLFDLQFERYNLNFVAVWGGDVAAGLPIEDDELDMTAKIPERLGRPFVIDTRAVVAHHSFYVQKDGIGATDLLDRWRAFVNENVCAPDNQKVPFDDRCPGF